MTSTVTRAGCLLDWFCRGLEADPAATALTVRGCRYTYQRLYEEARALAAAVIEAAGPRPSRVGILAGRDLRGYAGLLAGLIAGATVVPLNVDYPAARTSDMIAAAGLSAIIVDERGQELLSGLGPTVAELPAVGAGAAGPVPEAETSPDDIAYILFTSGSTGRPKGVPVRHRNVDHYLHTISARYRFTAADVFSQTFELTFDLAMFDLFAAWGAGASVVSADAGAMLKLPEFLARNGITVWFSAPSAIGTVRRLGGLFPGSLPGLRWSLFCGEPLLRQDARDWQAAAPHSTLENLYGPTELTISCSVQRWSEAVDDTCVNDVVPIGRVHEGLDLVLLGAGGRPDDREGELCVTGAQMFPGYLNPADGRDRFVSHEGRRYYRTGDMVRRLPGGDLAYLGRSDHQVNIAGCRIELTEIDCALRRCAGVTDAVTVTAGDTLVSFYTGDSRPQAELRTELGALIPRFMVPRFLRHLDDFPLNANRKTDRPALRAAALRLTGRTP